MIEQRKMNNNNNDSPYISFLKTYENIPIKLVLKTGFKYSTKNLIIINNSICKFTDLRGEEILVSIDQISQVTKEVSQ